MENNKISKEAIVAEYLTGNLSYRALEAKYQIPSRKICDWVLEHQGRKQTYLEKRLKERERKLEREPNSKEVELTNDVKILQAEVKRSLLHIKLLEEIIRLSEEHTGLELKKKFGTKQS